MSCAFILVSFVSDSLCFCSHHFRRFDTDRSYSLRFYNEAESRHFPLKRLTSGSNLCHMTFDFFCSFLLHKPHLNPSLTLLTLWDLNRFYSDSNTCLFKENHYYKHKRNSTEQGETVETILIFMEQK